MNGFKRYVGLNILGDSVANEVSVGYIVDNIMWVLKTLRPDVSKISTYTQDLEG